MNRYPLWVYILVAIVVGVGVLYSAPNLFPESPAIQISAARSSGKIDQSLLTRTEEVLKGANVAFDDAYLDESSAKVRFKDTDTQLKAKDLVEKALGEDYTVALNLLSNAPRWMTALRAKPMYLGLDLRGGVHFLLQVDMKGAITKALDSSSTGIRTTLRGQDDARASGISREGATIVLRFRDEATRNNARNLIERNYPDLLLRDDERGGERALVGTLKPEAEKRIKEFAIQQNLTTLRNRVNELGVAEPIVQQAGLDRIVVQLPGVQNTADAKRILGRTATLEVRMVDEENSNLAGIQAAQAGQPPLGSELLYERNGTPVLLKRQVVLTGDRINDAQPGFDQQTGEPAVHITLDGTGARIFQQLTRENVGKRMAMVVHGSSNGLLALQCLRSG